MKQLILISFATLLLLSACGAPPSTVENDLTLPNFSFIGLAEPTQDSENIQLAVHVKIPYSELKFTRSGNRYLATYEVGISVADEEGERIMGEIWKDSIFVDAYERTRQDHEFVHDISTFILSASQLKLSIRVTDLFTRKTRILSDAVDHSDMYKQSIALGNIAIINGVKGSSASRILTEQAFYEIIDTLRFQVKLIGKQGPYVLEYKLFHKDEVVKSVKDVLAGDVQMGDGSDGVGAGIQDADAVLL